MRITPAAPVATVAPATPGGSAGTERRFRPGTLGAAAYRALGRCHRWAQSGWGGGAVAGWGALQASVVPGPTDGVLVPLGLADPRRVFNLALWATLGSVAGGIVAFLIGAYAFDSIGRPLLELLGVSAHALEVSESAFASKGWMLVVLSTISPLSSKMVCMAAGAFGVPLWLFVPALAAGRLVRFFTIGLALRYAGPRLHAVLSRSAALAPASPPSSAPVQLLAS